MPPRPIYRWKSLWFGLLGLLGVLFILWLWIATARKGTGLFIGDYFQSHTIGSAQGAFVISKHDEPRPARAGPARVDIKKISQPLRNLPEHPTYFRPGFETHLDDTPRNQAAWEIRIAWWLILTLYLILWLGATTLLRLRQRRLLESQLT